MKCMLSLERMKKKIRKANCTVRVEIDEAENK
jgi:hypothetical protein